MIVSGDIQLSDEDLRTSEPELIRRGHKVVLKGKALNGRRPTLWIQYKGSSESWNGLVIAATEKVELSGLRVIADIHDNALKMTGIQLREAKEYLIQDCEFIQGNWLPESALSTLAVDTGTQLLPRVKFKQCASWRLAAGPWVPRQSGIGSSGGSPGRTGRGHGPWRRFRPCRELRVRAAPVLVSLHEGPFGSGVGPLHRPGWRRMGVGSPGGACPLRSRCPVLFLWSRQSASRARDGECQVGQPVSPGRHGGTACEGKTERLLEPRRDPGPGRCQGGQLRRAGQPLPRPTRPGPQSLRAQRGRRPGLTARGPALERKRPAGPSRSRPGRARSSGGLSARCDLAESALWDQAAGNGWSAGLSLGTALWDSAAGEPGDSPSGGP